MKKCFLWWIGIFWLSSATAQEIDSVHQMTEIRVNAFEQYRAPNSSTASVRIMGLDAQMPGNQSSFVQNFNSIAGVRMEERSPGSYRINIRGSSLRSPFGVRNIKVYWNNIPVTDAGGNTYFNQFAWNNISHLELFKGPAGSLYGAGTGGLILLDNLQGRKQGFNFEYLAGSYGLHNVLADYTWGNGLNKQVVTAAHTQSDGYRKQSAMQRNNLSYTGRFTLSDRQSITAALLYTRLWYETPGGLTAAEFAQDPSAARPAAGIFPGAEDAKAAILQNNLLAGITHHYRITNNISNSTVLFGAFTDFENSAVRNFENRSEPQWGLRSSFSWKKNTRNSSNQLLAGVEWQRGNYKVNVSDNLNGSAGNAQSKDDVRNNLFTAFLQNEFSYSNKWFVNTGISINSASVQFNRHFPSPASTQKRTYKNEFSPRIAILYRIVSDFFMLASVSRGFSPPTTAELLPSTGIINTELNAEYGWNYELSLRKNLFNRQLQLELTGYYLPLQNALVQRRDGSGADYFVNAGEVSQNGLELQARYSKQWTSSNWIKSLLLQSDLGYQHFRYKDFIKGTDDFSGNTVPSVPQNTFSFAADLNFKNGMYTQINIYTASRIFLNDANTAEAKAYQLGGWKLGWKGKINKRYLINLFAGIDNLFDQTYSLGNDINAAAGRYFNAAAPRNYYGGFRLSM